MTEPEGYWSGATLEEKCAPTHSLIQAVFLHNWPHPRSISTHLHHKPWHLEEKGSLSPSLFGGIGEPHEAPSLEMFVEEHVSVQLQYQSR